jgi:LL-H family phage holin|nr:MAG TPA: holin [Caudoviricetes sp.]
MNNISELIVAISTALIPIVFAWIGKVLANNKKALSLLNALTPLAEAAVTAAAQLGVNKYLSGEAKKSKAVQYVINGLNSLGFTNADEMTVKNAVEKAFSDLQDELYKTYPQATDDTPKSTDAQSVAATAQSIVAEAIASGSLAKPATEE